MPEFLYKFLCEHMLLGPRSGHHTPPPPSPFAFCDPPLYKVHLLPLVACLALFPFMTISAYCFLWGPYLLPETHIFLHFLAVQFPSKAIILLSLLPQIVPTPVFRLDLCESDAGSCDPQPTRRHSFLKPFCHVLEVATFVSHSRSPLPSHKDTQAAPGEAPVGRH